MGKRTVSDLALLGGSPLFQEIVSTSNLVQPEADRFFEYMKKSFDARWITNNGPAVKELEHRLAEIHHVDHCVSMCSGFWALVLCMQCMAKPDKSEVVIPSLTYRRLADSVAWLDLVPRFCEVSSETLGITRSSVEDCVDENTALILAPHPIVNLCDIDGLEALAKEQDLPLLFDSVEAAHATHQGTWLGGFGDAECYSVHASKFLNGFEGGYVTTNDAELADELRLMRAFSFYSEDNVKGLGFNAKLNEVHAAMTLASVDDIPRQLEHNQRIFEAYASCLSGTGLGLMCYSYEEVRTFKNVLVKLEGGWPLSREQTLHLLHSENMLARPYYHPPLHSKETSYRTIGRDLPISAELSLEFMLLPSGAFVKEEDVIMICDFLGFIRSNGDEIAESLENL